jgi:hypothetical protein
MLGINLAKWKRWSREFLPPDPLGGLQSGYARQYHPDQAFTVILGGHMVSELKFSIPEVRQILQDLHVWLKSKGFFFSALGAGHNGTDLSGKEKYYLITIENLKNSGFRYTARGVITRRAKPSDDGSVVAEQYSETVIKTGAPPIDSPPVVSAKLLYISRFLLYFTKALGIDPVHYGAMNGDPYGSTVASGDMSKF